MKRGITLLEILFSIFILLAGLLGIAVIISVGTRYASDAEVLDRSTSVMLQASESASAAGADSADQWKVAAVPTWDTDAMTFNGEPVPNPPYGQWVLIDPLAVDAHRGAVASFPANVAAANEAAPTAAGFPSPIPRFGLLGFHYGATQKFFWRDVNQQEYFRDGSGGRPVPVGNQGEYSFAYLVRAAEESATEVITLVFRRRNLAHDAGALLCLDLSAQGASQQDLASCGCPDPLPDPPVIPALRETVVPIASIDSPLTFNQLTFNQHLDAFENQDFLIVVADRLSAGVLERREIAPMRIVRKFDVPNGLRVQCEGTDLNPSTFDRWLVIVAEGLVAVRH